MNNLKEKIKVSVVEANIPLLLGLEYQMEWGMVIDLGQQGIYIRKIRDRFNKEKETKHWMLPIQGKKQMKEEIDNLTYTMNLKEIQDREEEKPTKIPFLDENSASRQPKVKNNNLRKQFTNKQRADKPYRKIDISDRIQEILAHGSDRYSDKNTPRKSRFHPKNRRTEDGQDLAKSQT